MEKLTLENVVPYLPYGLHTDKGKLNGCMDSYMVECRKVMVVEKYHIEQIKPILRPMDLTNTIIVEGKEVTPIVELAKIAYNTEWFYKVGNYNAVSSAEVHGFEYNETGFEMYNQISGVFLPVKNQYALFQWHAKHKFDFMGLIPLGLGIDVNTLETNPYNS